VSVKDSSLCLESNFFARDLPRRVQTVAVILQSKSKTVSNFASTDDGRQKIAGSYWHAVCVG